MMAANESDVYQRIIRRIRLCILVLGPAGSVALGVFRGPAFAAGFLLGSALSYVSFWRWTKVVDALTGAAKPRSIWLWLLRFAMLIGAGYVIVKYLEVTPVAVFLGLLVSAAAVVISITYEAIFVKS
jgi:hypothetical protein